MNVSIRHGWESDARALADLAARTFQETFAADNRPEDMALHIARAYSPSSQLEELRDPNITTLLADVDGQLVGYAQLRVGSAPRCVTGEQPVELWRFYVASAWHGRGVAQLLMKQVELEARRRAAKTLWLGVWEHNERAKAFYLKAGFTDVGSQVFMVGSDAQIDRVLVRQLRAAEARNEAARHGPPSWLALLGWIALSATAGAVGGIASSDAGDFYGALAKPTWAPPGWLFAPVWSALYLLMGIAAWLVWRDRPATAADRGRRRRALALFVGQLALNALWTWLFFVWRQGAIAFGEIVLLWLAVVITAWHFGRVRPLAAYLLVPYLAWVSFAAALTWAVWQRNPGQL